MFHVPPANVDTIFVYSWALSALAGNHNVVRVSSRSAGAAEAVLEALNAALSEVDPATAAAITATQRMVTYDRSDEVSGALSLAADLRVIWGGDGSVAALRKYPLAPHARDLTFPDRSSFAVASVAGWQQASDRGAPRGRRGLLQRLVLVRPGRLLVPARGVLGRRRARRAGRGAGVPDAAGGGAGRRSSTSPSPRWRSRSACRRTARRPTVLVKEIAFQGNGLATLELTDPAVLPREWLGAGTFANARVSSLSDLVPIVLRKDQTVSQFGFTAEELTAFAHELGGPRRRPDRAVRLGPDLLRGVGRLRSAVRVQPPGHGPGLRRAVDDDS